MKKIIRTSLMCAVLVAFLAVSGKLIFSMKLGEHTFSSENIFSHVENTASALESEDVRDENAVFASAVSDEVYILREHGGKIGIFDRNDAETPIFTLDVYVFTLPEDIADMLADGIICGSDELYSYIDSFTS